MRGLQRARDAADRATLVRERALAKQSAIAERIGRLQEAAARTVGQLGRRDQYRQELRTLLDSAVERVETSMRTIRETTTAVTAAQELVERALRARDAAEAQRTADDKAETRRRERRDQAASDDRWRPPRRG